MKKYTLFVFVLFYFTLFTGSANAYNEGLGGCNLGYKYNTQTGQLCNLGEIVTCPTGYVYSSTTGQKCTTWQDNSTSDVAQFNAVWKSSFKVGVRGDDVKALQQFLKDNDYYYGKVDGKYGRITARAVKDFMDDNDIGVTTEPTPSQPSQTNNTPVISGVTGPQTLNIGQQGKWEVTTLVGIYGNSYSVVWGDENLYPYTASPVGIDGGMNTQSATFTHTYSIGGTFTPIFTVTNNSGQTAKTSLTVKVLPVTQTPTPAPSLQISLDKSTPLPSSVVAGTSGVTIGSFVLTALNSSATIQFMGFRLTSFPNCPGMNFKLYSNGTQLGSTVAHTDSGCGINFNNLNYLISQNGSVIVYIKADINFLATPVTFAVQMNGVSVGSDLSYNLPVTASNISVISGPTTTTQMPTISYLRGAGCSTNIGAGSGLCSTGVPGGTVYVFGSNFDSNSKILFYTGNNPQLIPVNFISSTSLSFVVPANLSNGTYSVEVYKSVGNNSYQSNNVSLPVNSSATAGTGTDSDNSPDYSLSSNLPPSISNNDLFVKGFTKDKNNTIVYDQCNSDAGLNEGYVKGDGTVTNIGILISGYICVDGKLVMSSLKAPVTVLPILNNSLSTYSQTIPIDGITGAPNKTKATYTFSTSGGTATITELKFSVNSPNTVTSLLVDGTSVAFVNGVAYITGLNILAPNNGSGINKDIYVSYPAVGPNGIQSGSTSRIALEYIKFTSNGVAMTMCTSAFGSCTQTLTSVPSPIMTLISAPVTTYTVSGTDSDNSPDYSVVGYVTNPQNFSDLFIKGSTSGYSPSTANFTTFNDYCNSYGGLNEGYIKKSDSTANLIGIYVPGYVCSDGVLVAQ